MKVNVEYIGRIVVNVEVNDDFNKILFIEDEDQFEREVERMYGELCPQIHGEICQICDEEGTLIAEF
jgi:hypothetical protein